MALNKKQSIILLHGAGEFQKFDGMQLGELVIRHAAEAKDAALYTLLNDGNTLVQFPSKEYVASEILRVNSGLGGVQDELTRLENAITAETAAREEAIQDAKDELHAEVTAETKAREEAISAETQAREAADTILQGNIDAVDDKVDELATTHADDKATLNAAITANTKAIEDEVTARTEADTKLTNDLSALSGTVTTFIGGHQSIVDDLQGQITANATAIANEVTARTEAVENAKTELNNAISAETQAREEAISAETQAREAAVKVVSDKVNTLVGEDTEKSIRSIASEEVAKIVAGADQSYDTLKEIADWILAHPESVANLNSQIKANADAISALTQTHNTDKDTLNAAISANTTAIANEVTARETAITSARTDFNTAISAETEARVAAIGSINDKLTPIENSYINNVVATDAAGTSIVEVKDHIATFNFSNFVIDGGTYE